MASIEKNETEEQPASVDEHLMKFSESKALATSSDQPTQPSHDPARHSFGYR